MKAVHSCFVFAIYHLQRMLPAEAEHHSEENVMSLARTYFENLGFESHPRKLFSLKDGNFLLPSSRFFCQFGIVFNLMFADLQYE